MFLTPRGVKLLDFGLARQEAGGGSSGERLTATGTLLGTPGFMAPEQIAGEVAKPAADLFAFGALLFEMLTGRPAFSGRTPVDVCHAVLHGQPPALVGGTGAEALDLVLQRTLAKRPEDRPASAAATAEQLRRAAESLGASEAPSVAAMTRIAVLPLRVLRPDPDCEMLAMGLADALVGSLQGLPSVIVRSTHAVAKHAGPAPDLAAIARDAQVDVVVLGTLAQSGERVRVSAQLVEAPGGAVLRSESVEVTGNDLFRLQDELASRISQALSVPLAARTGVASRKDVPKSPEAYELYLRGTQVGVNRTMWGDAEALFQAALRADPDFAPTWARLARIHRVMAKYGHGREHIEKAHEELQTALRLNPDLGLAHLQFAHYEIEELGRPQDAMVRVLGLARKQPNDPDLLSALVLSCRFCGLTEASLAADRRARRLDAGVRTSVAYTWWTVADYERAMLYDDQDWRWMRMYCLPMLGKEDEAVRLCDDVLGRGLLPTEQCMVRVHRAAILGDRAACVSEAETLIAAGWRDPEGHLFGARALVHVGAHERGLERLADIVRRGFTNPDALRTDPWLDPVRADPRFVELASEAERRRVEAAAHLRREGGDVLLGI